MNGNNSGKPNMYRVLMRAVSRGVAGVRVSLPGVVVSYDKAKQRADIKLGITDAFFDEDGTRTAKEDPILTDIPIAFPGAGGYAETWPISKGDTVLVVWCSRSLARWKQKGGTVDPGDDRRHAFPDAVAYAGVRDYGHALANVNDDSWTIRVPSGKKVRIGGPTAAQSVPRGEALVSELVSMFNTISSQLQAAANDAGSATAIGIAMSTAISAFSSAASSYLSSKVKIE